MSVKISSFEKDGRVFPTINLVNQKTPDAFGFTFGVQKARLIMENIDEIAAFVKENTHPKNNPA